MEGYEDKISIALNPPVSEIQGFNPEVDRAKKASILLKIEVVRDLDSP